MVSKRVQIKVTVPIHIYNKILGKAKKLGLPVASYLRYLVIKDIEDLAFPNKQNK